MTKYTMNHLRQQVMLCLEADWPQSLWQWDNQEAEICTMQLKGMDMEWMYHTLMIISQNPSPPLTWCVIMIFPACCHLLFTTSPTCQLTMIGAQHIHWRMGKIVIIWKASYTDGAPLTEGCYLQKITCACSRGGLSLHAHLRAFSAPPRLATVTQMTLAL